tara:strand:+ start:73 stop:255 length:183 start_codon:yes stop_codon:yes gene_type:complete
MSYHGFPPPDFKDTGISVVNPLIQIEQKFKKIRNILDNISENTELTAYDLKIKLLAVMND